MFFEQGTIGTREQFQNAYGEQPIGTFIRSILGLDVTAAKTAFAELLSNHNLNSHQIRFIDTIINFHTVKGTIDPAMLFESPFTDISSGGIMSLFDGDQATQILSLIEEVNRNAVA